MSTEEFDFKWRKEGAPLCILKRQAKLAISSGAGASTTIHCLAHLRFKTFLSATTNVIQSRKND